MNYHNLKKIYSKLSLKTQFIYIRLKNRKYLLYLNNSTKIQEKYHLYIFRIFAIEK